jgi:hypothetical protein
VDRANLFQIESRSCLRPYLGIRETTRNPVPPTNPRSVNRLVESRPCRLASDLPPKVVGESACPADPKLNEDQRWGGRRSGEFAKLFRGVEAVRCTWR